MRSGRFRIALTVALVLSVAIGGAVNVARQRYDLPGPLAEPRNVLIPRGGPEQVGEALVHAGVLRDMVSFHIAALLTFRDGPLHAGELAFPAGASLRETLAVLRSGKPVQHRLTIPEGLTASQIVQIIDKTDGLTGSTPTFEEGQVLPQTYAYDLGASRASVIERATAAMSKALDRAWTARSADLPLATPQDLLILASIVERETARPEERSHVAAVFLSRLRQGMKLQSDPTVLYAVSGGAGTLDRALTRADLENPSPYNTYRSAGLPPGPIDSPGVASLQATANPLESDDLYFVADGTGGHVFARKLDDHQRNVARWRALGVSRLGEAKPGEGKPGAPPLDTAKGKSP
jgi:UPF0755 protein